MFNFNNIKLVIEKSKFVIIIGFIIYLAGLTVGVILPTYKEEIFFNNNTVALFINSLVKGGNVGGIILNRLFVDLFCLALFLLSSISIFLLPINIFIVFYRAYVIGAVLNSLCVNFGLTGFVLCLLVIIFQSLLSTSALIYFTCNTILFSKHHNNCDKKFKIENLYKPLLLSLIIILASIVLQVVLLLVFLRPMNYSINT